MNQFSCVSNILQRSKRLAGYPPNSEASDQDSNGKSGQVSARQIGDQLGSLFSNHNSGIWLPFDLTKGFELLLINNPARSDTENDELHRKEESSPKRKSTAQRPVLHVASPIRYPVPLTVWMSLLDSP